MEKLLSGEWKDYAQDETSAGYVICPINVITQVLPARRNRIWAYLAVLGGAATSIMVYFGKGQGLASAITLYNIGDGFLINKDNYWNDVVLVKPLVGASYIGVIDIAPKGAG